MSLAIGIFNQQHTANAKPPRLSITRRNLPFTRYHKEQTARRRGMPIARPARGRVHETNLRRRQKSGETQRRSWRRVISQRQIHFDIFEMRFANLVGVKSSVNDHLNSTIRGLVTPPTILSTKTVSRSITFGTCGDHPEFG